MAKLISGKMILIVGGAGFIGWSLARTLLDNEVVILDDLSNPAYCSILKNLNFTNRQ